jgi:hypothetical protein
LNFFCQSGSIPPCFDIWIMVRSSVLYCWMILVWQQHHVVQRVDASKQQQQRHHQLAFITSIDGLGTSMAYDDVTDRVYITGDRDDDCWLGILQLPLLPGGPAEWIRNVNLGLAEQTESCTTVRTCRTGNSRRLFITGISFGGSSLLQTANETTTTTTATGDADDESSVGSGRTVETASYSRTSGWLWDVSWYGEVIVRLVMKVQ